MSRKILVGILVILIVTAIYAVDLIRWSNRYTSANSAQFRQSTEKIYSSTASQLDIDAATEIELASTTIDVNGTLVVEAISVEAGATGVTFTGAYTNASIDFTNVVLDHSGSSGPVFIRAGTYGSPVTHADEDQSGMIRLYGNTTADGSSYDRGIFVALQTHGTKAVYPIAGLAEIHEQSGAGPGTNHAGQFIAMLQTSTSKLAAGTAYWGTMNAIWAKIGGVSGSTTASGSTIAPIWVDNQMTTTINGLEYGLYNTTGASRPDAWAGFYTSSSGYDQLFYFDATWNSGAGTCVTTDAVPGGNQDARIKVNYNGTQYYIPLYR